MRKTKGFVAMILSVVIVGGLFSAAYGSANVSAGHWSAAASGRIVSLGALDDMDGAFDADSHVTRAQFIHMINQLFGFTEKSSVSFEDVPEDAWYAEDISIAANAGLLGLAGDDSRYAGFEDAIDRQMAAAIAYQAFQSKGYTPNATSSTVFTDISSAEEWARSSIGAMASMGVLNGFGDGTFKPTEILNYAQAASMLSNLLDAIPTGETGSVSVTFDLNGGNGMIPEQKVAVGSLIQRPAEDPVREGYFFDAWYTAPTGGTDWELAWNFDSGKAAGEDFTLYARWVNLGTQSPLKIPVSLDYSDSVKGWILTIKTPLVATDSIDLSPTIRLGNSHYTIGHDFTGGTVEEQAESLASVIGKVLADDNMEDYNIEVLGDGKIALIGAEDGANKPVFFYSTFRPGNWWIDMSYNPENPLAANDYREVRESDRIRPFSSWEQRIKDGVFKKIDIDQPELWYEVYSLPGKATYAIVEPYYTQEVLSLMVVGDDKVLIIDSGMGYGDLKKAVLDIIKLEKINIDIDAPGKLLITTSHTHEDHTSGNYQFRNGDFYVLNEPMDAKSTSGNDSLPGPVKLTISNEVSPINENDPGDELMLDLPSSFVAERAEDNSAVGYGGVGTIIRPGVRPGIDRGKIISITVEEVDAGYELDLGGRKLGVVYTPGHTNDSLTFIDADNKLVFTGDFYYSGPNYAYSEEADPVQYAKSADKLWAAISAIIGDDGNPAEWWVYGQHNEPVKDARIIEELSEMANAVLNGELSKEPWKEGGNVSNNSREPGTGNVEYRVNSDYSPTGNIRLQVPRALYFD